MAAEFGALVQGAPSPTPDLGSLPKLGVLPCHVRGGEGAESGSKSAGL
jgi:hypothetical protein